MNPRKAILASAFPGLSLLATVALVSCGGDQPPKAASPTGRVPPPLLAGVRDQSFYTLEYVDGIPGVAKRFDERRWIVGDGTRLEVLASGATRTSSDALPKSPQYIQMVPPHIGKGFLFVVDNKIYRSDDWLGALGPPIVAGSTVQAIYAGLDRMYVVDDQARVLALSGDGGLVEPIGWPSAPFVSGYFALDAWRAVASGDLIGTIITTDGGRTWIRVSPALVPSRVASVNGRFYVLGSIFPTSASAAASKAAPSWFEIDVSGKASARDAPFQTEPRAASARRSPLGVAVESGFPMEDGSILYVDEGVLTRIREIDGSVIDRSILHPHLRNAACQATELGGGLGVGFICDSGEATSIHLVRANGQLEQVHAFATRRRVRSSGNGALVVSGPCGDGEAKANVFCVRHASGRWQEVSLAQATGRELVVARKDETLIVVRPPNEDSDGAFVVFARGKATPHPLGASACASDKFDPRSSIWLDGFEEREGGSIGGWLMAEQKFVSVEIDPSGAMTRCTSQPSAGPTLVAGRYGFTWLDGAGAQTKDGGKTWTKLRAPLKAQEEGRAHRRSCGPAGCVGFGWVRTGWAEDAVKIPAVASDKPKTPSGFALATAKIGRLDLECSSAGTRTAKSTRPEPLQGDPTKSPRLEFFGTTPIFGSPAPDRIDLYDIRNATSIPIGRMYAWAEDALLGANAKWSVAWLDPLGRGGRVFSSDRGPAPQVVSDNPSPVFVAGKGAASHMRGATFQAKLEFDEDPRFAMLLLRAARGVESETVPVAVQDRVVPQVITRADREPFHEIDDAARVGGSWYLAPSETFAGARNGVSSLYRVEGTTARLVANVPRDFYASFTRKREVHLATSSDGRTLGMLVETGRAGQEGDLWLLSIDIETGGYGLPAKLPSTASQSTRACAEGEEGLRFEVPLGRTVALHLGATSESLTAPFANWLFNGSDYCLEGIRGVSYKGASSAPARTVVRGPIRKGFPVHLVGAEASEALACDVRAGP